MLTVLVSLTIVMFLPLALAIGSIKYRREQFGKPDIQYPRDQAAKLTGAGKRIVAAQANAWEALGLFTVALLFCYFAGVDFDLLIGPAVLFVAARVAHALCYIMGRGELRFLAFFAALGALVWMLSIGFLAI